MKSRFLGLSDEQRLAIEETTGIKTEGAQMIVDAAVAQANEMMNKAIREVQEVIGPHGSITRLQAGGVRISPGSGVSVFEDGVLKTTIEPDGDFLAGSDITQPSTTTFCVFVNEQTYNNESMGAGDLLIGDNSSTTSNIKYDASEGQLQFRLGTTVNVYMDTDGSLRAGGGSVILDSDGINLPNGGDAFSISVDDLLTPFYWRTYFSQPSTYPTILNYKLTSLTNRISNGDFETGDFTNWTETDPGSKISVVLDGENYVAKFDNVGSLASSYISQSLSSSANSGCVVSFRAKTDGVWDTLVVTDNGGRQYGTYIYPEWRNFHVKIYGLTTYAAVTSIRIACGSSAVTYVDDIVVQPLSSSSGAVGIQSPLYVDGGIIANSQQLKVFNNGFVQFRGITDLNLFYTDPDNDRVGIGTSSPAEKLDVVGNIIASGTITGSNTYFYQAIPGHASSGTIAASTTMYVPPFSHALNASRFNFVLPRGGTLKNLRWNTNSAQPASGSLVCTVQVNNADSALTATVAANGAAQQVEDLSNTVAVSAGAAISFEFTNNATGTSAQIGSVTMELEIPI